MGRDDWEDAPATDDDEARAYDAYLESRARLHGHSVLNTCQYCAQAGAL